MPFLNISTRKVGGLRFVKIGRLSVSFCITRRFRPLPTVEQSLSRRASTIAAKRYDRALDTWLRQPWVPSPESYPATLTFIDHDQQESNA